MTAMTPHDHKQHVSHMRVPTGFADAALVFIKTTLHLQRSASQPLPAPASPVSDSEEKGVGQEGTSEGEQTKKRKNRSQALKTRWQQRKRRKLGRPLKISAPIPQHQSMQFDGVAASVNPKPDSGIFYLVPNKLGPGKTLVKRPRPASPPILPPDDHVANDQDATALWDAPGTSAPYKQPRSQELTPAPFLTRSRTVGDRPSYDTSPIESPPAKTSRFDPVRVIRNSFRTRATIPAQLKEDAPLPQPPHTADGTRTNWKGKEKALSTHDEEASEIGVGDQSTLKANNVDDWMAEKSGSDIHRSATYPIRHSASRESNRMRTSYSTKTRQTKPSRIGSQSTKHKWSGTTRDSNERGPKAGQKYEIVNRRIVSQNPHKTVEISTWREHTDRQDKKDDEERMSVYYLSGDDFEFVQEANRHTQEEWMFAQTSPRTVSVDPSTRRASSPQSSRYGEQYGSHKIDTAREPPPPPPKDKTISPSTSGKASPSEDLQRRNGTANRNRTTTRRDENNAPHSPTATRSPTITSPILRAPPLPAKDKYTYMASTPLDEELSRSPFKPTQSGSTVSSIKSEATLRMEAILDNCEPSLLHIAPALRSLGIRKVEHLKAMARLTPSTRDREVKEGALKLGITVMEWAIFVDMIFTL